MFLSFLLFALHLHLIIIVIIMLLSSRNNNYVTFEKFIDAIQAHVSKENYAIVKDRSKSIERIDDFNNKVNLRCDRDKQSRKDNKNAKRKRKIFFIKIECLFRVNIIRKKSNNV